MSAQKKTLDLPVWIFAILLIGVGVCLHWWRWGQATLVNSIAEALIVAGVLAFAVDPFLKKQLMAEASRSIFIHLLGFEHHPQVKDRLQKIIYETKLLRKTCDLRCVIKPCDGHYLLTVEYDTEIINPTNTALAYRPALQFDRAHKLQVLQMTFTSSDGKHKFCKSNLEIKELKENPGVEAPETEEFVIEPDDSGITYKASTKYRIKLLNAYCQFHAGSPALQTTIRAEAPKEYEVRVGGADVANGNYWQYNKIMMVGDHFTLRWRTLDGEWL